ncbi:MAG: response regulator [Cyanobacteria bacterium P01_H01_bin.130]
MNFAPENPPPTVLIVDDDRATQILLAMAMEEEGYTTVGAQNGEQALEEFRRLVPNLVLMDAMMPEMDGFTCCERLRSLPEGKTVPILTITVLDDQESVDRAFAAGTTDYVTKPIYWPVLCQRVRRLVEAEAIEQQLGTVTQELRRAEAWEAVMAAALSCRLGRAGLGPAWRLKVSQMLTIARQALGGDRAGLFLEKSQTWLEVLDDEENTITPVSPDIAQGSLAEGAQGLQGAILGDREVWPTLEAIWGCRWGMIVALVSPDDNFPDPSSPNQSPKYLWIGRSQDLPWCPQDQQRWQRLGQLLSLMLAP